MRVLLLDNYDSFTWNLAHYLQELGADVDVRLNDAIEVAEATAAGHDAWVVSPGPGRPEHAGASLELVRSAVGRRPLLGVCLGHQTLAQACGARIVRAEVLMHGKTSAIHHDGRGLFRGLSQPFEATRYHSLIVDPSTVDARLQVTARTTDGVVMGLRHRDWPGLGVQFHPESVMTREGKRLIGNFLSIAARWNRRARAVA